jgi:hypothetical protein
MCPRGLYPYNDLLITNSKAMANVPFSASQVTAAEAETYQTFCGVITLQIRMANLAAKLVGSSAMQFAKRDMRSSDKQAITS